MKCYALWLLLWWGCCHNAAARWNERDHFNLGQGFCGTNNPAGGGADFYVDDNFLITADPEVEGGRDGRLFIYTNSANWKLSQILTDLVLTNNLGWFGFTIGVSSNWLAVGSTHSAPFGPHGFEGDVQMFFLTNRVWEFRQFLRPTNYSAISDDEFGDILAIDGDWMVVGAPWHDYGSIDAETDTGAVFFYHLTNGTWSLTQGPLIGSDTSTNNSFGIGLGIHGTNAYVGGWPTYAGKVYWFQRTNDMWFEAATISPIAPRPGETFGTGSIQQDSGHLLIAAPMRADPVKVGGVYFFDYVTNGWRQNTFFQPPDNLNINGKTQFGNSVALRGNVAVIGVRFADNNGLFNPAWQATNALGRAYVLIRNWKHWVLKQELAPSSRQPRDYFASSVATDGTNVFCISGNAVRTGTNTMICYSFTNTIVDFPKLHTRHLNLTSAAP